jgi:hypothetical protein
MILNFNMKKTGSHFKYIGTQDRTRLNFENRFVKRCSNKASTLIPIMGYLLLQAPGLYTENAASKCRRAERQ